MKQSGMVPMGKRKVMLEQITWKEYIAAAVAVTASYYGIVGLLFYKKELKELIGGKFLHKDTSDQEVDVAAVEGKSEEEADSAFAELERVVDDLKDSMNGMAGNEVSRDELLKVLSNRLANFDGLRRPAFLQAIIHFVIEYSKEHCGVDFSEEELAEAWAK